MIASASVSPYVAPSQPSACRELLTVSEASSRFGLSPQTLRLWTNAGKLPTLRTLGGHRRIDAGDVLRLIGGQAADETKAECGLVRIASVCRVSGFGQNRVNGNADKSSLEHQKERVSKYIAEKYPHAEVTSYNRVGSGMFFEHPVLLKLVEDILAGKFRNGIVIAQDPTRILRFGHQLISHLCKIGGCRIEYIFSKEDETQEESLTADIMSIMTSFTSKINGRKSKRITEVLLDSDQLRDAFLMYKAGHSYREISERFEKEGRGTDSKGKTITHNVCRARLREHWATLTRLYGEQASEANSFLQFVEKKVKRASKSIVRRTEVVKAYKTFCEENKLEVLNKTGICHAVRKLKWATKYDNEHCVCYVGVELVS